MAKIVPLRNAYYSDFTHNGKRIKRFLSTDRREAQVLLGQLIKKVSGRGISNSAVSWQTFKEKYLEYCAGAKSAETVTRDKAAIRSLEKYRTPRNIGEVDAELLDHWKAKRRADGKKAPTINRDLQSIKTMLRWAVSRGYADEFRAGAVKKLPQVEGRLLFYTPEQLSRLLAVCQNIDHTRSPRDVPILWETVCLLGSRAGLRRAEIYWLSWHDISFERGLISVTPKEGWHPKNYSVRHIPISDDLRPHLRKLPRTTPWVLGDRPNLSVMSTGFGKLARRAKLSGGLHTLRHTFASHLAQAGVPIYTISKLLGHKNLQQTSVYSHLCPETFGNAVAKLPVLSAA